MGMHHPRRIVAGEIVFALVTATLGASTLRRWASRSKDAPRCCRRSTA